MVFDCVDDWVQRCEYVASCSVRAHLSATWWVFFVKDRLSLNGSVHFCGDYGCRSFHTLVQTTEAFRMAVKTALKSSSH
jgi:hypothetical protein